MTEHIRSGWTKFVFPPHRCDTPVIPRNAGVGSEWTCPECHQVWVVSINPVYWRGDPLILKKEIVSKFPRPVPPRRR